MNHKLIRKKKSQGNGLRHGLCLSRGKSVRGPSREWRYVDCSPTLVIRTGTTDERLDEAAPFSPGNNANETVGSLPAGLAFHGSYHCGRLGVLRRLPGKGLCK